MINYIIQVMLFQTLFLVVYDLLLSKETFFTKNRLYLLSTAMLSFVLPFLKVSTIRKVVPQDFTILLPEVVLSPQRVIKSTVWYQSINYLDVLFWSGVVVFLVVFIVKLINILKLIFTNEVHLKSNYKLVLLPKNSKAFSFFNYIFLGREIPQEKQVQIIQHELVHSRQKHTIDLLFFELLKIMMWFNPLVYLYQKRITLVHEFISDAVVTKSEEKSTYINSLLSEIFQVEHIVFINQFYKQSLIKKRILMMTKNKSKPRKQVKYLLLIPVIVSMLFYTACSSDTTEKTPEIDKELKIKQLENQLKELRRGSGTLEKRIETDGNVPFAILDVSPTFPDCPDGGKKCFNKKMQRFVAKNFNIDLAKSLGLSSGRKKIFLQFKIDKTGNVTNIKAKAPHSKLEEEAIRIAMALPQLKAGKHNGEAVATGYTLPIVFNVE